MAEGKRKVPEQIRRRVYRILSSQFDFETMIDMARAGSILIGEGIDKQDFGYGSFKSFIRDMGGFAEICEVVRGGVTQYLLVLHRDDSLLKPLPEEGSGSVAGAKAGEEGLVGKRVRRRPSVGGELFDYALVPSWPALLDELAEMALDEAWSYPGDEEANQILDSYLRFTFYRLQLEDKILTSDNGQLSAVNTGLVDDHYDDIFMCFRPTEGDVSRPWEFSGFCKAGGKGLGKRLVSMFNPLPQPASYFQSLQDLLFDVDKELICDYQHMLIDNIDRLPLALLKDELRESSKASKLIRQTCSCDPDQRTKAFGQLASLVGEDKHLYNRLRNRMETAVRLAQRQARWNYRVAVPSYNPRTNSMSLLLPLSFEDGQSPGAALVVTPERSGNYQGQTILTMRQAYVDARLLCQISENWLRA